MKIQVKTLYWGIKDPKEIHCPAYVLRDGDELVLETQDISIVRKFYHANLMVGAAITTKYESSQVIVKLEENEDWDGLLARLQIVL